MSQSCNTDFDVAIGTQQALVTLNTKKRHRGREAELVLSRNPTQWSEIKTLLENLLSDSRNLYAKDFKHTIRK